MRARQQGCLLPLMLALACRADELHDPPSTSSAAAVAPSASAAYEHWMPVQVGRSWTFQDAQGEMEIRVSGKESVDGRDAFRVDWRQNGAVYQSEFWAKGADGLSVVAREVVGRRLALKAPWLYLKSPISVGSAWRTSVATPPDSLMPFNDELSIQATLEEEIQTPAGRFSALRVDFQGKALAYRRWYAANVGLVGEDTFAGNVGNGRLMNTKRLVRYDAPPAEG